MPAVEITEQMKESAAAAASKFGLSSDLHPEDQLLRHLAKKWGASAGQKYIEGGRVDAEKIRRMIEQLRITKSDIRVLDFAAGFGRVARHVKGILPHMVVHASDIHSEACAFMEKTFEIPSFVSSTRPDELETDNKYDVIYVLSLFSHLPDASFGPWIGSLYRLLSPGGFLFFTANGRVTLDTYPEFYGAIFKDGDRCGFRSESDQLDLDKADYGSMIVSVQYVLDAVNKHARDAILHGYSSGGWLGTQDGWILKKPNAS